MVMMQTLFGLFIGSPSAQAALSELRQKAFTPTTIPLNLKDTSRQGQGTPIQETQLITGLSIGAALGGIMGLLLGLSTVTIPAIHVFTSMLGVSKILATTTMGVIFGGLVGGLIGIILPAPVRGNQSPNIFGVRLIAVPARLSEMREVESIMIKHNVTAIQKFKIATNVSLISEDFSMNNEADEKAFYALANPIEVQKFLKHVDYPMTKEELVHEAEIEGADEIVINTLERLPEQKFTSPIVVSQAIGQIRQITI